MVVGFGVGWRLLCGLLFLDVLCSQEFFWFSQVLGLSLLLLDFSFILTIVSRLFQLYSTDNKTSRLMVKRFSTLRDNQRGSQSYMKNRRGRKEIGVSRGEKGGLKRRETDLRSYLFSKCSP